MEPPALIGAALSARARAALSRTGYGARPAIVKQIEPLYDAGRTAAVVAYIARDGRPGRPPRLVDETGTKLDADEAGQLAASWCHDRSPVLARHFVFSLPASPEQAEAVGAAVEAMLRRTFGAWGHRFIAARHDDTEHPHVHAVIEWRRNGGDLLPLDPSGAGLDALRHALASEASDLGLQADGTRTADVADPSAMRRRARVADAHGTVADETVANDRAVELAADLEWRMNRIRLGAATRRWVAGPAAAAIADRLEAPVVSPLESGVRGFAAVPDQAAYPSRMADRPRIAAMRPAARKVPIHTRG